MVWPGVHVDAARLTSDKGASVCCGFIQSTEPSLAGGPALIYLLVTGLKTGRFRIDLRQGSVGKARLATKTLAHATPVGRALSTQMVRLVSTDS